MRTAHVLRTGLAVALAAAGAVTLAQPVSAATDRTDYVVGPAQACGDLAGLQISARALALPTSGATVSEAVVVPATSATGTASVGEHCRASLGIRPVDPTAPEIRVQVALPTRWNVKTVMFGGGGYDGTVPALTGNVPFGPANELTPLGRGYVTYASDSATRPCRARRSRLRWKARSWPTTRRCATSPATR